MAWAFTFYSIYLLDLPIDGADHNFLVLKLFNRCCWSSFVYFTTISNYINLVVIMYFLLTCSISSTSNAMLNMSTPTHYSYNGWGSRYEWGYTTYENTVF